MLHIEFPSKRGQRYYDIHWMYIHNLLQAGKCHIIKRDFCHKNFVCKINGILVQFDHSDSEEISEQHAPYMFKFHYTRKYCINYDYIFPMVPVSFHNWVYMNN